MRLQALRGAITCTEDSKAEIDAKTARLVKELFARNELTQDDVVSILFTTTPDLTAEFPASRRPHRPRARPDRAARRPGAGRARTARRSCIRVLVHCYTDRPRDELHHVFLEGAAALRADLAGSDLLDAD